MADLAVRVRMRGFSCPPELDGQVAVGDWRRKGNWTGDRLGGWLGPARDLVLADIDLAAGESLRR